MKFDPVRFFELAEDIGSRADEAALRTAVSRAYYACALTAAEVFQVTAPTRFHVILRQRIIVSAPQLAMPLERLAELRVTADYPNNHPNRLDTDWVAFWTETRTTARWMLDELGKLRHASSL